MADGRVKPEEVIASLIEPRVEDLGFARLDHDRTRRKGFPEVVFGSGKTSSQIASAAERIYAASGVVLVTRIDQASFDAMKARIPEASYNELGRLAWADRRSPMPLAGGIVLATAGTSDQGVAEEAAETARLMGCEVRRLNDVGVAGIHRLLAARPVLESARVIIAVAGMEGALPSVIAGLVAAPVIAVPTSVGYGANFEGIAPLLGMLNSCAPGVAVVNIDNGFGAGYLAAVIARQTYHDGQPRSILDQGQNGGEVAR
jgi:NCAIR mutase (PurE)-related protein